MHDRSEIQKYREMLENLPQQPENLAKLEQLAENGNAEVMYILGWCYFKGEYLVKDLEKSQYWLANAKNQGHKNATELLVYVIFLINHKKSRNKLKTSDFF